MTEGHDNNPRRAEVEEDAYSGKKERKNGPHEAMSRLYGLLGEVLDLMARHEGYANKPLARAHMDLLPPLALRQYRLTRDKEGTLTGYISWAKTSRQTLEAFKAGEDMRSPQEWQSGELGVVIDVVSADAATSAKMIGFLKQQEFTAGRLYAMRLSGGKSELTEVELADSSVR